MTQTKFKFMACCHEMQDALWLVFDVPTESFQGDPRASLSEVTTLKGIVPKLQSGFRFLEIQVCTFLIRPYKHDMATIPEDL